MINKLLSFHLRKYTLVQISLNIDVKERGHSAYAHSGAVLGLDSRQISKVKPLHGLSCVLSRSGNIKAIELCHLLHSIESLDLL